VTAIRTRDIFFSFVGAASAGHGEDNLIVIGRIPYTDLEP